MAWPWQQARCRIALDPETTRLLWSLVAAELAHRRRRQRQRRVLLAAAGLLLLMVLSLAAWQAFSITLGGL